MTRISEKNRAPISTPNTSKAAPPRTVFLRAPHVKAFFLDVLAIFLIGYIALYFHFGGDFQAVFYTYTIPVALAAVLFSAHAYANHSYDWARFQTQVERPMTMIPAAVFTFGVLLLVGFVFKESAAYSRAWGLTWAVLFTLYLLVSRIVLSAVISAVGERGTCIRNAVIIGAGQNGQEVLAHLRRARGMRLNVVGFLDDRINRVADSIQGVPVLGTVDMANDLVRRGVCDTVILAMPWHASERIGTIMRQLSETAADVLAAPDSIALRNADRPMVRFADMTMLNLTSRPIGEWNAVIKRIEDLCLAVPAVLLLSPLLALVALAIRLESRGPVFFVQDRYGFNQELIKVYKFRSMYAHLSDHAAAKLTSRNDARVTRVGRFIRRTNIDELPQLFNVILGNMSLVGPRPHALQARAGDTLYQNAVETYPHRHRVKPGITGWAQCNGWRGETDTIEKLMKRVEFDLEYIENWSVLLDLEILVRTVLQMVRGDRNAY